MVNLCSGGTKDFTELWEIVPLKIWTHFAIRQLKLFWINLEYYNQTCSNDHLCKTTTRLGQPMLNPPKQIPIQMLLCKKTTCLTRPVTTFWVPNEKTEISSEKEIHPAKKYNTNIRNNAEKINVPLIIFTPLLLYGAKFVSYLQKLDNLKNHITLCKGM